MQKVVEWLNNSYLILNVEKTVTIDFWVDHLQDGCIKESLPSNPDEISQRNPENSIFASNYSILKGVLNGNQK